MSLFNINTYTLEKHVALGKYTPERRVFTKNNEKLSSVSSVKSSLKQQIKEMLYNSAKYERKKENLKETFVFTLNCSCDFQRDG